MGLIERRRISIPLEQIEGMEELFFRQIQMDGEKVLKKFRRIFEETKEDVYAHLSSEGIWQSFRIEKVEDEEVLLEGEEKFNGEMISRVLKKSDEAVICAITIHGYDEMEKRSNDFIRNFFYDGWGTAFAESAFVWLKDHIKEELLGKQLYFTCSWSPGQHNVDIRLQKVVFRMINPGEIGMILNERCMMEPKKSISGFFGIGTKADIEHIRACDFCERRKTCPSVHT